VIENDLTRIAVALETIAQALIHRNDFLEANFDVLMRQPAQVKINSGVSSPAELEVKETPVTHDTIGTGLTVEVLNEKPLEIRIPEETPTPELKFEEVSKAFFAFLNVVKATQGIEEAKQVATDLIRQYNNGKPISLATLPKESYAPLMARIEKGMIAYESA
jgi:hypothetical protein